MLLLLCSCFVLQQYFLFLTMGKVRQSVGFTPKPRKQLKKETKSDATRKKEKTNVNHFMAYLTGFPRPLIPLTYIDKEELNCHLCDFISGVSFQLIFVRFLIQISSFRPFTSPILKIGSHFSSFPGPSRCIILFSNCLL